MTEWLKMEVGNFYIEVPDDASDYVCEVALLCLDFAKKFIENQIEANKELEEKKDV